MVLRSMLLRSAFIALLATLGACASQTPVGSAPAAVSATLQGDAARPAQAQGWVRSELYFGLGEESGPADRPQAEPIRSRRRQHRVGEHRSPGATAAGYGAQHACREKCGTRETRLHSLCQDKAARISRRRSRAPCSGSPRGQ